MNNLLNIPFYSIIYYFNTKDPNIRQTCHYFEKNIRKRVKLEMKLYDPSFGIKLMNIFNEITFIIPDYSQEFDIIPETRVTGLRICSMITKEKLKKYIQISFLYQNELKLYNFEDNACQSTSISNVKN